MPGVIPHHRHYVDLTGVEMFPGVTRRTLVSGANATLVEIRLAVGAEVPEHTHPHEQAGYLAAGRIAIRFGPAGAEEPRELGEGASYLIPGGVPHFVRALEGATLVEVFAPVRAEFVDYDASSGSGGSESEGGGSS
jgi:quercetin dioxygenase-like cupin family protein